MSLPTYKAHQLAVSNLLAELCNETVPEIFRKLRTLEGVKAVLASGEPSKKFRDANILPERSFGQQFYFSFNRHCIYLYVKVNLNINGINYIAEKDFFAASVDNLILTKAENEFKLMPLYSLAQVETIVAEIESHERQIAQKKDLLPKELQ